MAPLLCETLALARAPQLPDTPAQPVNLEDPEIPPYPVMAGSTSATFSLGLATEHFASYRISQVSLNALISGLQYGIQGLSALKVPLRNIQGQEVDIEGAPSMALSSAAERIRRLRRKLRTMRRAGARRAEVYRRQGIGRDSVIGAVAEALCANFFLSFVGLRLERRSGTPERTGIETSEDGAEPLGEMNPPASNTLFGNQMKKRS